MNVCVEVSFDAAAPGSPGTSLVWWFRAARTGLYRGLVKAEAGSGGGGEGVSEAQIVPDIDDLVHRFPRIGGRGRSSRRSLPRSLGGPTRVSHGGWGAGGARTGEFLPCPD